MQPKVTTDVYICAQHWWETGGTRPQKPRFSCYSVIRRGNSKSGKLQIPQSTAGFEPTPCMNQVVCVHSLMAPPSFDRFIDWFFSSMHDSFLSLHGVSRCFRNYGTQGWRPIFEMGRKRAGFGGDPRQSARSSIDLNTYERLVGDEVNMCRT